MLRLLIFVATTALLALPTPALADFAANLGTFVTMEGKCTKAVFAGHNYTRTCHRTIASNRDVATGRMLIHFTLQTGYMLTVVTAPDAKRIIRVHVATGDGNPGVSPATGKCSIGNPLTGRATISCKGTVDKMRFDLAFRTNGKPPAKP